MPSKALSEWQAGRMARLNEIEAQCAATLVAVPPNPDLADENLRGYVMLLSAHFQGFCRDLYSECVQVIAGTIPPSLAALVQVQCQTARELDGANPRYATLRKDFDRFGLDLTAKLATDPANALRVTRLDHLNAWRNYAAHRKSAPPRIGGPFDLPTVRVWKDACDELAKEPDRVMYNELLAVIGAPPW
jgi:hypothetical protein